jgi:hypothetical protein
MAPVNKKIFYPRVKGELKDYYDNAADAFAGPLGTKYGTSAGTVTLLNNHKTDGPLKRAKAFADAQIAQMSYDQADAEDAAAKVDMLMEMQRVQRLPIWDETDAEAFGMRKEKTPVDLNTVKGKISKATPLPDKNVIDWIKAGMEGIIIESLVDALVDAPQQNQEPPLPAPPEQNDPRWKRIGTIINHLTKTRP